MYDNINPPGRCYLNFPDEGIDIFIPSQGIPIRVNAEMISLEELTIQPGEDFKPHRAVIKFELQTKSGEDKKKFDPSIELRVFFTKSEKENLDNISIAYLPEKTDEKPQPTWIKFTEIDNHLRKIEVSDEKLEKLDDNAWAGYFHVLIDEWKDPSVSVGN